MALPAKTVDILHGLDFNPGIKGKNYKARIPVFAGIVKLK